MLEQFPVFAVPDKPECGIEFNGLLKPSVSLNT
jgi:hypothetical protein